MSRSVFRNSAQAKATLLTGLMFAVFALSLQAQPVTGAQRPGLPGYDRAHEVTVNATIQKVIAKAAPGSPAGMHLIVAGPQGIMDAHVGPYLSRDVKAALQAGAPVQMIGATEKVRGKSFFLVRQLAITGRTITVRSGNGFLVEAQGMTPAAIKAAERSHVNGGAR